MINLVIEACGIKKLSEVVDVRPTPDMVSPCLQLQDYFSQITPALQQYLVAKFEEVYQSLEQMNMRDILANARFYQVRHLYLCTSISLNHITKLDDNTSTDLNKASIPFVLYLQYFI